MDRVLIVDDEPQVLAGIRRALGRYFDIDAVSSAEQALHRLQRGETYAAIVSDLSMADMDGLMLLERARQMAPATPRLMLTGHADRPVLLDAINRAGVSGFLQKPVSPQVLREALQRAIGDARQALGTAVPGPAWMAGELARADLDRDFQLLLQPRIGADSGRLVAAEGLLRWTHPEHGPIGPADFIPVAEATDQIDTLTDWVLARVARAWRHLRDGGVDLPISVNVSLSTIGTDRLVGVVDDTLGLQGMPADRLEIEITESHRLEHTAQVRRVLAALRELGARTALDDFGTGYASLQALRALDVDMLKIDRSFVTHMGNDAKGHEIVRSITELAHALSLTVVAEGVETREHATMLHALGVHQFQGHLFAPALRPELLGLPGGPWQAECGARAWLRASRTPGG